MAKPETNALTESLIQIFGSTIEPILKKLKPEEVAALANAIQNFAKDTTQSSPQTPKDTQQEIPKLPADWKPESKSKTKKKKKK